MIDVKLSEIASWCGGELHGEDAVISSVTKDSRVAPLGSLYLAIKGDRFDGNDFVQSALDNGATAALTSVFGDYDKPFVLVSDTKKALLDIASGYRDLFDIPSVAITGSVGKTTTKEMIASVLGEKFKTLKTEGNFNNEIGMPLMALKLDNSYEIAVFEMGMSAFFEISNMTRVSKPDMAVINNIGMSHIGNLGSQENILKAKLEVLEGLRPGGVLAVNGDDKLLKTVTFDKITYGIDEGNDIRAYDISEDVGGCSFKVNLEGVEYKVRVNIPGIHNVYNALAASAVGIHFGVEPEKIISGIAKAKSVGNRMDIKNVGGIKLIADCYNASPDSVKAALGVLKAQEGRKVAVLADMLEMGEFSKSAHEEVGKTAEGIDAVISIGNFASDIEKGAKNAGVIETKTFTNNSEANEFLKGFLKSGDVVLVKGSHGMKLTEICEFLEVTFK